jgi:hypothetical protein
MGNGAEVPALRCRGVPPSTTRPADGGRTCFERQAYPLSRAQNRPRCSGAISYAADRKTGRKGQDHGTVIPRHAHLPGQQDAAERPG